jgi:hypothetical protein
VQRQPRVHDVLDEDHVPLGERGIDVLQQPHSTLSAALVRCELDDVERVRDGERAGDVREEDDARLERRDQDRIEARVITRDLVAELGNPGSNLRAAEIDGPEVALVGSER